MSALGKAVTQGRVCIVLLGVLGTGWEGRNLCATARLVIGAGLGVLGVVCANQGNIQSLPDNSRILDLTGIVSLLVLLFGLRLPSFGAVKEVLLGISKRGGGDRGDDPPEWVSTNQHSGFL